MKTVYASLTGRSGDRSVIETSLLLNRLFDCWVDFFHVRLDAETISKLAATTPFTASYLINEQLTTMTHDAAERGDRARKIFDSFAKAPAGKSASPFSWHEVTGIDTDETIARSHIYELLVLGRDPEMHYRGQDRMGAVVMGCGRPVLIVPDRAPTTLCETVVLAWKDRPEAARALTAAAPLLAKAKRIVAVHVREGSKKSDATKGSVERLAEQLRRHGYPVEAREVSFDAGTVAEQLRAVISETNADLFVTGAYGHSRLRELILGGVTEEIIENCAVPTLLFH